MPVFSFPDVCVHHFGRLCILVACNQYEMDFFFFFLQTGNYFGSLECEQRGGDSIVPTCEVSIRPWRNEVK